MYLKQKVSLLEVVSSIESAIVPVTTCIYPDLVMLKLTLMI